MSLGWILAIVLGVFLMAARRELRVLRARRASEQTGGGTPEESQRALTASFALATLRLQLRRMRKAGQLEESEYEALTDRIDACWASDREGTPAEPHGELWWSSCETGWNILTARGLILHGRPPWRKQMPALELELELEPMPGAEAGVEQLAEAPAPEAPFPKAVACAAQAAPHGEPGVSTAVTPAVRRAAKAVEPEQRHPATTPQEPARPAKPAEAHAWRPTVPGP